MTGQKKISQFEDLLQELRTKLQEDIRTGLNPLNEKLDWIIGKYQSHDEEHILLNGKVSEHSDDIEVIKQKLHIQL